jgi:diguanylate cyclase (GGDEF)-like protein
MTDAPQRDQAAEAFDAEFRESRTNALIAVNLNTFWSIAIILLAFGLWDWYVDPDNWRSAFRIRLIGALIVSATGLFQKLPGKARFLPAMAKIRLVIAVTASVVAAAMLDRGYGFGVAGLVVILLTGPYVAIDSRDLMRINLLCLGALALVLVIVPMDGFDVAGTAVFGLLAVAVSTLLGRVLETSNRRAFMLERELHRDARTDALTGLNNRRAMEERGPNELKRAIRSKTPVSLILGDLDHFKAVNDLYGHEAGDAVLRAVADVLRGALRRETDSLGRWGGEEFMALLVNTDAAGALEVAERMRVAVAEAVLDGIPDGITISLGVSTLETIDSLEGAWETLGKEADRRLYRAKREGRNRVVAS